MTLPAWREWICTLALSSVARAMTRLSPNGSIAAWSVSISPSKKKTTSSSVSGSGSGRPVCPVEPSISARRDSKRITRPAPPASTTPASRRAGNCEGVRSRAIRAAVIAALTILCKVAPDCAAASPAASAAAFKTVITVPSTGSAMARSTSSTACCRERAKTAPSITESTVDSATPRRTWDSTIPEFPRAPRTAPSARESATSPPLSSSATAASMVCAIFEPVSESGTGKTLSALISSRRWANSPTARVAQLRIPWESSVLG